MAELSRNSYNVYIIHMVVMGLLALPLLHVPISGFPKFIVLSVLTFTVSNVLIYTFREVFQVNTMLKVSVFSSVVVLLVLVGYVGQQEKLDDRQQELAAKEVCEMGIHEAIINGDPALVKQLISSGADVNQPEPMGGSTPLMTAALFGEKEIIKLLLESGADINLQNNEGSTALHTASFFCHEDIVKLLLEKGADKSIRNKSGSTAFETVKAPFEVVSGIYEYIEKALGPIGLTIDKQRIEKTRPEIAKLLQQDNTVR